jgi:hypothetical protein
MRLTNSSIAILASLGCALVACSSTESGGSAPTGGGSGATAGATSTGGTSSAGTGIAGTSGAGGGTAGSTGSQPVVGVFDVKLSAATATTSAYTDILGLVKDGPTPPNSIYVPLAAAANPTPGCTVYSVSYPACVDIGGCGTNAICVATNQCQSYPNSKNVGTVTVTGIATSTSATSFTLTNISNNYQVPGSITLQYPGFAEGDPIKFSATGGDYAAFEVSTTGIAPLVLTNSPYTLARDTSSTDTTRYKALTFTWGAPGAASHAAIHAEIYLTKHAGNLGYIVCDVADTGSLTISADVISQLVGLGVGGFPTLEVTRIASGSAPIAPGLVEAHVTSLVTSVLNMEGYTWCNSNKDCAASEVCCNSTGSTNGLVCVTPTSCTSSSNCPCGQSCNTATSLCDNTCTADTAATVCRSGTCDTNTGFCSP